MKFLQWREHNSTFPWLLMGMVLWYTHDWAVPRRATGVYQGMWTASPCPECPWAAGSLGSSCLFWLVSSLLSGGPFLLLFLCLPDTLPLSPHPSVQTAKHFRTWSSIRMDWPKGESLGFTLEDGTSKTVTLTILDASKAFQIKFCY